MQGVVRQDEPDTLFIRQTVFDEREIQIRVATINLVAHDGMADVGEVEADLMLAAGVKPIFCNMLNLL